MRTPTEVLLSILPAASDQERVALVMVSLASDSYVELRQQSYGAGVGWFTQSSVRLEPQQVAALRNSLGDVARQGSAGVPRRDFSRLAPAAWSPRLVQADSA